MSADHDYTMTTLSLLAAAEKYRACATFHIEEGGSRHFCSECGGTEVDHIIVALRAELQEALSAFDSACDRQSEAKP